MPTEGEIDKCLHCGRDIMFARYNGKIRWCHVPLLRVRCQVVTEAEPHGSKLCDPTHEGPCIY